MNPTSYLFPHSFISGKADPALLRVWNQIFSLEMKLCILNVVTYTQLFSKMVEKQCIWMLTKIYSKKIMTAKHLQLLKLKEKSELK